MNSLYLLAFIGGAVATVNPCGFALLPAYLARRINAKPDDNNIDTVARAIAVGAVTTCGFLAIFGLAAAALSLGAYWLMQAIPWAGLAIGIVLVVTGLVVLTGRKISLRLPILGERVMARSWVGDLLFGFGYGTVSISCTLPLFLAVTGSVLTGSLLSSVLAFSAYAAGMGTVLMALAIAAAYANQGLASWIKKTGVFINRFSGGVLVLSGIYVTFYWATLLLLPEIRSATGMFTNAEIISGLMRAWLDSPTGNDVMIGTALIISAVLGWVIWSRLSKKRPVTVGPPKKGI